MISDLLLIPTESELRFLRPRLSDFADDPDCGGESVIGLCGFGMVAAAARAAALIAKYRPRRVILVGIAGALSDALAVGSACTFDRVRCDGIGVGTSAGHLSVEQMGWSHWAGSETSPRVGDTIELASAAAPPSEERHQPAAAEATLLSVCAASAHPEQAQQRQQLYPEAIAEDMEGFAVALACSLAGVPLRIVRGISNRAGDRKLSRWQIQPALEAAAAVVDDLIKHPLEEAQ